MRIQLGSPAQNHFQITLTMLSVNRILHVPGAHAHITPAPQPHYACVRSVLPAYLQRCYEWLGHSELLILPRFQTSRSATCAQIHDPPVTQARPAGLRECCRSLWSRFPALTCPRVRRPTTQPQDLLAQTGSFPRTAHDAKNLPIRAQYFCTTVSVLKCPPRAKRWSRIPALSANRLTDRHGTYGSSFAWNIRIFSGVNSRT